MRSGSVPTAARAAVSRDGNQLVFTLTRRDGAESPDVTATVESGTELSSWPDVWQIGQDTASSSAGVSVEENGGDDDIITVAIPLDGGAGRFARLVIARSS